MGGGDICDRPPGSRLSAGGEDRTLTDVFVRRLLRPVRLPVPPRPQRDRSADGAGPILCRRSLRISRSYLGAFYQAHIGIWASHARRGAGTRTPSWPVLETGRSPAPHPSGCVQWPCPARETKEPPPCGSGSLTVLGLLKVLVNPSRAPPCRDWPTRWRDRRTRASTWTASRATSPGFVPLRSAGSSGCQSDHDTAW